MGGDYVSTDIISIKGIRGCPTHTKKIDLDEAECDECCMQEEDCFCDVFYSDLKFSTDAYNVCKCKHEPLGDYVYTESWDGTKELEYRTNRDIFDNIKENTGYGSEFTYTYNLGGDVFHDAFVKTKPQSWNESIGKIDPLGRMQWEESSTRVDDSDLESAKGLVHRIEKIPGFKCLSVSYEYDFYKKY